MDILRRKKKHPRIDVALPSSSGLEFADSGASIAGRSEPLVPYS